MQSARATVYSAKTCQQRAVTSPAKDRYRSHTPVTEAISTVISASLLPAGNRNQLEIQTQSENAQLLKLLGLFNVEGKHFRHEKNLLGG